MKDKERIKGIVEAILFTMGESVALSRLAEVLEVEEEALKDLLEEMKGKLQKLLFISSDYFFTNLHLSSP